jgi:hypothetical protein
MSNPAKVQRAFNNPGAVRRALERMGAKAGAFKDATPTEIMTFLSMMRDIPAAYDIDQQISTPDNSRGYLAYQFSRYPAAMNTSYDVEPTVVKPITTLGKPIRNFWRTPNGAEAAPARATGAPGMPANFLTGWAFHMQDLSISFWNAGSPSTPRAAQVRHIRTTNVESIETPGMGGSGNLDGSENWQIIGHSQYTQQQFHQVFSTRPGGAFPSGVVDPNERCTPGWLRDFPLLPHAWLLFDDWQNIGVGSVLQISMTGYWRFYPSLMESGDEPNE